MKILYYCYGGSHSSVTAAGIHLGLLPSHRIPTAKELMQVPYFDVQLKGEHGELKYMGRDSWGNEVYIMGIRHMGGTFRPFLEGVARIIGIEPGELLIVDSLVAINNLMRFGGFLSRRWGWIIIGRPLVILGTQAAYWDFVSLVKTVTEIQLPRKTVVRQVLEGIKP